MPRSNGFSPHLNTKKQSTGIRPLIVFCLISLLLLTFYIREGEEGPVHSIRSGVSIVATPIRMAGALVVTPFNALGNVVGNLTTSQETLSELKQENADLTAQVAELSEAKKTAERLESLVGLQSTYNLTSTAARIIGSSSDAWSRTVTIDKGSASGFAVGMAVCNSGGVIGQIVEVSATTSTVQLATDEGSGISAMVQSTRAQGMLRGQADGTLRLSYVSTDYDVAVGDIVITSGIGGVFPKGLPLGTVSSVEKSDNDVYYTIVVRAQSTAENNEEVLVITSLNSDQIASNDDVTSANAASQSSSINTSSSSASNSSSKNSSDDSSSSDSSDDSSDSSDSTD